MLKKIVYGAICIFLAIIGVLLAIKFMGPLLADQPAYIYYGAFAVTAVVFALLGLLLAPPLSRAMESLTKKIVASFSAMGANEITSRIIGLVFGLIIGSLLGSAAARINVIGPYLAIIVVIFFGYLGWLVGARVGSDLLNQRSLRESSQRRRRIFAGGDDESDISAIPPKVLDTSVIIDGRIADIYRTGFLEGDLVIPNFVLCELRHIADSSDSLKRNRGRSGLDTLNRMREQFNSQIVISEQDYPKIDEVDSKLLRLAQDLGGVIVTNDFNLNKVAKLQGVQVLNINELANAVKPIVLPGEEMVAQVIKEGKEASQGVAYLDDGTMIVVENGARYVGLTIFVIVTSILQTAAGRMVFARPKVDKRGMVIEAKKEDSVSEEQ